MVEEGVAPVIVENVVTGHEPDALLYAQLLQHVSRIHDNRSGLMRDGAVSALLKLVQAQVT